MTADCADWSQLIAVDMRPSSLFTHAVVTRAHKTRRPLGVATLVLVAMTWLAMPVLGLVVEDQRTEYCCCGAEVGACECPGCPGKPSVGEGWAAHDSLLACSTGLDVEDVIANAAPVLPMSIDLVPPTPERPPPQPPPAALASHNPPAYQPPPS